MLIKENSSILIPIDFSKQSLIAIEQSYNLAKYTHCKIIVMHASPNSNHEHQKDLEEIVANIKKDAGIDAEFLNLKGDIYDFTIFRRTQRQSRARRFCGTEPRECNPGARVGAIEAARRSPYRAGNSVDNFRGRRNVKVLWPRSRQHRATGQRQWQSRPLPAGQRFGVASPLITRRPRAVRDVYISGAS